MKEETKCYCGHTTYCDCESEEPKQDKIMERFIANAKQQETLEEATERKFENTGDRLIFEEGAKWKNGKYTYNEWFEQFKKK